MPRRPIAEVINSKARVIIIPPEQCFHIVVAGKRLQTGVFIKHPVGFVLTQRFGDPQNGGAINVARARAHRQTGKRRVTHRSCDRLAILDCTKAGTIAKVESEKVLRQITSEISDKICIGQPVKPIAANACIVMGLGDGIASGHIRIGRMKCCPKAAILWKIGGHFLQRINTGQVVGVMQWRQRDHAFDCSNHGLADACGCDQDGTTMQTVPRCAQLRVNGGDAVSGSQV